MRRSVLSFVLSRRCNSTQLLARAALAVLACCTLSACSSDSGTKRFNDKYFPKDAYGGGDDGSDESSRGDPATGNDGAKATATRVNLGASATAKLNEFLNGESLLFGDVVEIHMSRKPFLSKTTFSSSPEKVLRTESIDGARGVLTITLQNRTDMKALLSEVPNVRIGNGFEIVGTEKIVLYYWTRQTKERPVHFKAVAHGGKDEAMYKPSMSEPAERSSLLEVNAEVRQSGSGYRFDRTWTQTGR